MRPPKLDERPVPVIPDNTIRHLLSACSGRSFEDRRDTAILFVLIDTGARLSEVADLRLDEDLDLEFDELHVIGKGRRGRTLPLGRRAMKALDRYLRARVRHKDEELHWLWLGPRGHLTKSGFAQMIRRRCRQAGVEQVHPHQFRHTFAHKWAVEGRCRRRPDAVTRSQPLGPQLVRCSRQVSHFTTVLFVAKSCRTLRSVEQCFGLASASEP